MRISSSDRRCSDSRYRSSTFPMSMLATRMGTGGYHPRRYGSAIREQDRCGARYHDARAAQNRDSALCQMFGGSNETSTPRLNMGARSVKSFGYYVLNSYTSPRIAAWNHRRWAIRFFTGRANRTRRIIRGDYQQDNRNNFSWVFLEFGGEVSNSRRSPNGEVESRMCCRCSRRVSRIHAGSLSEHRPVSKGE